MAIDQRMQRNDGRSASRYISPLYVQQEQARQQLAQEAVAQISGTGSAAGNGITPERTDGATAQNGTRGTGAAPRRIHPGWALVGLAATCALYVGHHLWVWRRRGWTVMW
ncbi:MAG: hypothetical protein HY660_15285 [Armatimonadetes bacterium]|nr:hypothetical protein [Armatimonadota bacterium]